MLLCARVATEIAPRNPDQKKFGKGQILPPATSFICTSVSEGLGCFLS